MFPLAVATLRYRTGGFVASFVNVFLGAAILMAFASLFDTAGGAGVSSADQKSLTTMAWVVGGWGVLIVAFGIAATLNLSVRQRTVEIALLKSAGATPGQVGRLVVGEAALVSVVAAAAGIPAAFFAGRGVLSALIASHQIADGTAYHFGVLALGIGLSNTFVAAVVAAFVSARRAASLNTIEAVAVAAAESRRTSRKRIVFGCLFLLAGADCATLTATAFHGSGFVTEALAGEACIHTSIGLALFAPLLMRAVAAMLAPVLRAFGGTSGYLASLNLRQRTNQLAAVLMPIILFTGMAAGSLYLQRIQNDTNAGTHTVQSVDAKGVETLNYIIVGMIAVFAAVVLINFAVATTVYRRREFGQQRLIGCTAPQVLWMLSFETLVTAIAGVVLGAVAALAGMIPYSSALAHRAVPDVGPAIYLGVAATAVVLTFAANLGAGRRAVGVPALDAVAV